MYYRTCPLCGANLDPEEKCDCAIDFSESMARRAATLEMLRKSIEKDSEQKAIASAAVKQRWIRFLLNELLKALSETSA